MKPPPIIKAELMTTTSEGCKVCQRQFVNPKGEPTGSYEVVRWGPGGKHLGAVKVCSVVCLIRWSHGYAKSQGEKAVDAVKGIVQQLAEAFRGPR